jgi:aspartate kinase
VLSSFEDGGTGTLIASEDEDDKMEKAIISGIAFSRDEAKLTLIGVSDKPGIAYHILDDIAKANIEVDMIVQNIGVDETSTDFTFTVHRNDYDKAMSILEDHKTINSAKQIKGSKKIAKISLVGVGMRSHAGIASKMFKALSAEGINIQMISTSEIKISVVVDEKYLELGVRALHSEFELDS